MTNQNVAKILSALVTQDPEYRQLFRQYEKTLSKSSVKLELRDDFGDNVLEILRADPDTRASIAKCEEDLQATQSFGGGDGKGKKTAIVLVAALIIMLMKFGFEFESERTEKIHRSTPVAEEPQTEEVTETHTTRLKIELSPLNDEAVEAVLKALSPAVNVLFPPQDDEGGAD